MSIKALLTSSCVQSASASFTLKVLGLLVGDENLQIVKVTLTVVAPWSIQKLFERGTASFLAHLGYLRSL
jgi:hypothetical protein